ncbi:MAG: hypothetical protein HHJ12_04945 [Glaciimonas sp.]|nr:hypothetical protein [Glaciimonas sp.]
MHSGRFRLSANEADAELLPIYKSLQENVLRFTEALVVFVGSGPDAITLKEMARKTRRRKNDLREIIQSLLERGQIKPDSAQPNPIAGG